MALGDLRGKQRAKKQGVLVRTGTQHMWGGTNISLGNRVDSPSGLI